MRKKGLTIEENIFIEQSLEGAANIEVKIHNTIFRSPKSYEIDNSYDYSHQMFKDLLAPLNNRSIMYSKRYPNCKTILTKKLDGHYLIIALDPKLKKYPRCRIQFFNPTKKFLIELYNYFPELIASELEFTVDIFCKSNKDVHPLYLVLKKYLYCPWKTITKEYHDSGSYTFIAGSKSKKRRRKKYFMIRVYERCPDEKITKINGKNSWNSEDNDRVRIEFIAYNDYLYRNNDRKVITLEDLLLEGFKSEKHMGNKFKFRHTKNSKFYRNPYAGKCLQEIYLGVNTKNKSQYSIKKLLMR